MENPDLPVFPVLQKANNGLTPTAHEFDGKLYVVYSIGKEDCGLSILPLKSL